MQIRKLTLVVPSLAIILAGSLCTLNAQTNKIDGFRDTPIYPGTKWHVHDPDRPQPPLVTPGNFSTQEKPGKPPSDAVVLFDGSDLSQWRMEDGKPATWKTENGAVIASKGDIFTKQEFGDIQLHIEFATPPPQGSGQGRGNSGVFFMNKYEVQVLDCYQNLTYADGTTGALYGQHPPLANACLAPGQWQVYDIAFTAPRFGDNGEVKSPASVTVFLNGVLVQNRETFDGPTGWKSVPKYTAHPPAGPLRLQDHNNPMRFRNIWVRPIKSVESGQ